ncbi:hypothetical protein ACFLU6_06620 [Acidobacteriota bacterium]
MYLNLAMSQFIPMFSREAIPVSKRPPSPQVLQALKATSERASEFLQTVQAQLTLPSEALQSIEDFVNVTETLGKRAQGLHEDLHCLLKKAESGLLISAEKEARYIAEEALQAVIRGERKPIRQFIRELGLESLTFEIINGELVEATEDVLLERSWRDWELVIELQDEKGRSRESQLFIRRFKHCVEDSYRVHKPLDEVILTGKQAGMYSLKRKMPDIPFFMQRQYEGILKALFEGREKLKPEERSIIDHHCVEDYTWAEAAELEGYPARESNRIVMKLRRLAKKTKKPH